MTNTFAKLPKAQKFRFVADLVEDKEVRDFLELEAARVEMKNAKRVNKPTKAQLENDETRQEVVQFFEGLHEGTVLVADEVMSFLGHDDFSPQKATALMKPLVDNGTFEKVEKTEVVLRDKKAKKVGYKLA